MKYPVDLTLFNRKAHNPSLGSLSRSLGQPHLSLVDFCVPVNPYFPTPRMFQKYRDNLDAILKYYPDTKTPLATALGRALDLDPETLVLGNGSTELITWIDHLFIRDSLVTPVPNFGRWTDQPLETGKRVHFYTRQESLQFRLDLDDFVRFIERSGARAVALCNPNNPTGAHLTFEEGIELLERLRDRELVVIDESFLEFSDLRPAPTLEREVARFPNAIVLKSLGKNFGLHGIRFGYAAASPRLALHLRNSIPHWNINALGETIIRDLPEYWEDYQDSLATVRKDRDYLVERLGEIEGLSVFPSQGNFAFVRLTDDISGKALRNQLITQFGYVIRECSNKIGATSQDLRIAAHPKDKTDLLVEAIRLSLEQLSQVRFPPAREHNLEAQLP